MLLQIRDFIHRSHIASNQQIAREFGLDIDAVEPILACWVRKKVIGIYNQKKGCKQTCLRCTPKEIIYYQFLSD